jgi:hypothetical protein
LIFANFDSVRTSKKASFHFIRPLGFCLMHAW